MSSVRAELALALESRGHGAAAVARGVEEVALALGIDALLDRSTHELSGGEKQRVALGAALAGRPRDRAARRADLAARPGRRRRADRPAAPAQPGVGDDDPARRAPPRALPDGRRPRDRAGARRDRLRRRPRDVPAVGRPSARPRCRRPARSCSRSPACTRRRSASQARATLRAHGLLPDGERPDRPRRAPPASLAPAVARAGPGASASALRAARRLARAARRPGDPARRRR